MKYPDFSKISVLIVGDLMLDKYHFGQVNRVSPEAPVPVVRVKQSTSTLGGAGNVVNNLYHLGANACLIAMVGNFSNGNLVKDLFDEQKVKYRLLFYRHINSKIIFILSSFLIVQSVSCDNLFLSSIRLLYTDHLYFIMLIYCL